MVDSKNLVREFYSRIDQKDWSGHEAMASGEFVAKLGSLIPISFKEWQRKIKRFYEGMSDGRHILEFYDVEGDRILTVGKFIGLHDGEFMGQKASGAAIEMGVMHLNRVVDDKIVEHTAAADLLGLFRQIGIVKI